MTGWKVERSLKARQDLLEIWLYVAADDASAADRLLRDLNALFDQTADFPRLGRAVEGFPGYRMLTRSSYLLFYRVDDEERTVMLMRVLHGARDWPGILDS